MSGHHPASGPAAQIPYVRQIYHFFSQISHFFSQISHFFRRRRQ